MVVSRDDLSPMSTRFVGEERPYGKRTTWGLTIVSGEGQWGMKSPDELAYVRKFCARTKELRERAGLEKHEVAEVLGIIEDTYKKYEYRRPLPHRYISKFCVACRAEAGELFAVDRPLKKAGKGRAAS